MSRLLARSLPLALALAGLATAPALAQKGPDPADYVPQEGDKAGAPVTLTNGSGDGAVSIKVDGYGSFGSSNNGAGGGTTYNPIGSLAAGGTTFESGLFFSPSAHFLTTDTGTTLSGAPDPFGTGLPQIVISKSGTTATSSWDLSGYHFALTQVLSPANPTLGSAFTQTYEITNNTGAQATIRLVRYFDGDLYFSGDFSNDFGGISADGSTLYEFDSGDSTTTPVTRVGISATAGANHHFTIHDFVPDPSQYDVDRYTGRIVANGGIPAADYDAVSHDADHNNLSDEGFDPVMAIQDEFTLAAGATLTYVTTTLFGDQSITDATALFASGFETGNTGEWSSHLH